MSKPFAQLAAAAFIVFGVGGFFTGDAGHVTHGQAGGNFDGVALHLTYARDVLNLILGGAFVYAGWFAPLRLSRSVVLACGCLLLLLTIAGFIVGDNAAGARSIAALHFPLAVNVFDLIAGTLAVLCALGDVGAPEETPSPA
jgi:hypothetical protein